METKNLVKRARKPLILIVDDVVKNIQALGNLLIENGYDISVAISDKQAVATAGNINPDLILVETAMREIDAFELCKHLKNNGKTSGTPVIFLDSNNSAEAVIKGFAVGGVDFINRPFHKSEVIARIENQLELKFSRDRLEEQTNEITTINSKLNEELTIAAEYFSSLLPAELDAASVTTHWNYVPTAKLGGDAFGYFWLDKEHFVIYLFDVCGHGIASGMYSVSLINTLRYQNLPDTDFRKPSEVFNSLNKIYQINEHYGMYFTIWYAVYNKTSRVMEYAAAGHHPSVISYPSGKTEFISSPNFIIGGLEKYDFISDTVTVEKNTDLYVFSDGTFDVKQPNGKIWNIDDMRMFIEARHSRGSKELRELYEFVSRMYEFSHQKDDFTILKVRFK